MASPYGYVQQTGGSAVDLFPGETFDPTMIVSGSLAYRGGPTISDTATAPLVTAQAADVLGGINWAVVLIMVGLVILFSGKE